MLHAGGIVGAAIVRSLTSASRVSQAQAQKTEMQSNLRAGGGLIPAELREINITALSNDLIALSKDSVKYRAMRRLGIACSVTASTVTIRSTNSFGLAGITEGHDSLLLFIEKDPKRTDDDSWTAYGITTKATALCPDTKPGTLLTVTKDALNQGIPMAGEVLLDAPIRTFEDMTLKVYESGGRKWLGMASNNAAVQPVLGPLANSDSTFGFRDAAGTATTTTSSVRVIEATLHGETTNAISKSGYDSRQLNQDSLRIRVRLRNAP